MHVSSIEKYIFKKKTMNGERKIAPRKKRRPILGGSISLEGEKKRPTNRDANLTEAPMPLLCLMRSDNCKDILSDGSNFSENHMMYLSQAAPDK